LTEAKEKYIEGYNIDVLAFAIHKKSLYAKIFEKSKSSHFVQNANLLILTFLKKDLIEP
jgi:hypothetical protein